MNLLERQLSDPARLARLKRWSLIALALIVAAEVLTLVLAGGHGHFAFEDLPAWGSLYGLVSCVAIIVVSKFLGKVWLMRPEDRDDD